MPACRALAHAMPVLALVLLPGCAPMSLSPTDRAQACRIDVDARLPRPVFVANPVSNESGAAVGALAGVLEGLLYGPAAVVAAPVFGIVGLGAGAACAEAASRHPSANADFTTLLEVADIGVLGQAVQRALNAPRAECPPAREGSPAIVKPDAVVEIKKLEATMGCLFGKQGYSITVHWRAVSTRSGDVLAESRTMCAVTSFRSVEDWFADPGYGRAEIERLLEKAGQRIAASLLGPVTPGRCVYRSREDGELE